MKLTAFCFATSRIPRSLALKEGGEEEIPIAMNFFLLEGKERMLVDAGCFSMKKLPFLNSVSPPLLLEQYGVTPDQISRIVLTHSHRDHAEALSAFPRARVLVHESEAACIAPFLASGQEVETFSDERILDEGVTVRHVGGHSVGSSAVFVPLGNKIGVLCGDETYVMDNFSHTQASPVSVDPQKNLAFLTRYRALPYVPILSHDLRWAEVGKWRRIEELDL